MSTDTTVDFGPCHDPATIHAEARKRFLERLEVVPLSDIETSAQEWLWPGRIPLGHVTLLAGDPGVGKSLLALDIAARVSRGEPWPDQQIQTNAEQGSATNDGADPSLSPSSSSAPGTDLVLGRRQTRPHNPSALG